MIATKETSEIILTSCPRCGFPIALISDGPDSKCANCGRKFDWIDEEKKVY